MTTWAERICRKWSRFTTLWEAATDEERADLLGSIVQVVEMTEKESVALELLPMPHSLVFYSNRLGLCTRNGSGSVRCYELSAHLVPRL